ncbi:hypothetical protein llap_18319 [Limosa lapponica baueri]|uniref:Uncharacterized protein n=1 Tax=Limosa lapponica baueri TaxID=1758121 RepID=A0A2I0TC47_LIMLA|nr:hypothetical protein llap_18319 [Limosa lapponica baueri]
MGTFCLISPKAGCLGQERDPFLAMASPGAVSPAEDDGFRHSRQKERPFPDGFWRCRRVSQDAQYPCLQRDEGNLQASLAGERLQREGEDERVWAEHQAPRERDAAKRAWVQLMPRGPLSLWGGTPGAWVAPVELKQRQHFFIPHPPEKTMEAAALEKSLTK